MHKILQDRLQQFVKHEIPDVQVGFRKGRGTRDQIANIRCIIKKARDGMGREEGGRFRMGNTCIPVVDSF